MGWGEASVGPSRNPGRDLAEAVRSWQRLRTTGAEERLQRALDAYDAAHDAGPVTVETGRRAGW